MSTSSASTAAPATSSASALLVAPYATIYIKNHISLTLELKHPNFNQWSPFFTSLYVKFGLLLHIDGTVEARPTNPAWAIADSCVRSWLLGSIGSDVLDLAAPPDQTARELWITIKCLFEANKAPHAIFLSHEFHSMTQGDSSVNDYCQWMKVTTDALRDVGCNIIDSELVLNILRGLNVLNVLQHHQHDGHNSGYGGGGQGGGGRWKKGGGGQRAPASPASPWYCYAPWTGGAQQQ
jgi:hypothetical protein